MNSISRTAGCDDLFGPRPLLAAGGIPAEAFRVSAAVDAVDDNYFVVTDRRIVHDSVVTT